MAVILEQPKRKTNWLALAVFIFLFLVIIGGGYFLFFAPTPGIEIIAPSQLEELSGLAGAEFDPAKLINDPIFKGLRQYGSLPSVGQLGRDNPFVSF